MARRKKDTPEMANGGLPLTPTPETNGEAAMESASNPAPESVEQRLQRLEDAVANLQDTRQVEERVTERVVQRVRATMPRTPEVLLAPAPPPIRPAAPFALPPAMDGQPPQDTALRRTWLLFEILTDFRAILRMYFDRRYPMTWLGRTTPVVGITIIVLSWLFLSSIWVLGPAVDRLLTLVVAFVMFKVASRELVYYRHMFGNQSGFRIL